MLTWWSHLPPPTSPHSSTTTCTEQLLLFTKLQESASKTQPPWTLYTQCVTNKDLDHSEPGPRRGQRGQEQHWLRVWGHLWRLGPWAGLAVMTYCTNLKGYSTSQRSPPCRLWCHISLWHLTAFSVAQRRDWIVLFVAHLRVCRSKFTSQQNLSTSTDMLRFDIEETETSGVTI